MGRDEDFDESSYVKVNTRLSQFRKDNPEGAIQTQRIGEDGGVIFKCLVFRNSQDIQNYGVAGVAPAAGHSYLPDWARDDDQKVEEYAETVAIGRALACLGYSVDKSIASAEEMNKYQKMYGEEPKDDSTSS